MISVQGAKVQMTDLEREKLELEKEKVEHDKKKMAIEREYEERRLKVEVRKARITAGGIGIPIIVAAVTIVGNSYLQNQAALGELKLQHEAALNSFTLKAAELIMGSNATPAGSKNRAYALSRIFQGQLPSNFAESFDPADMPVKFDSDAESKARFLKFAVDRPNDSIQEILLAWKALFPADKWAQTVSIEKSE